MASKVTQVLRFSSVTFDDVDPVVFTPPQAVRDLVQKKRMTGKGPEQPRAHLLDATAQLRHLRHDLEEMRH